jgi:hypothetical protein
MPVLIEGAILLGKLIAEIIAIIVDELCGKWR